MITKLKPDEILNIIHSKPEQALFDWKRDLNWTIDSKKAELLKDVVAIANGTTTQDGFIFYGLDPRDPDPVVGMSKQYDDATFQQFITGKVDPAVLFAFYTVEISGKPVGVLHVPPSRSKPHVITVDICSLRDGQIPIRRGSSTGGIRRVELLSFFARDKVLQDEIPRLVITRGPYSVNGGSVQFTAVCLKNAACNLNIGLVDATRGQQLHSRKQTLLERQDFIFNIDIEFPVAHGVALYCEYADYSGQRYRLEYDIVWQSKMDGPQMGAAKMSRQNSGSWVPVDLIT